MAERADVGEAQGDGDLSREDSGLRRSQLLADRRGSQTGHGIQRQARLEDLSDIGLEIAGAGKRLPEA